MVIVVNYWMATKSYSWLKTAILDKLMKTNLKFFAATAKILSRFLVKFKTNNPMVTFLAQVTEEITYLFNSSFLLKETLSKANTCLRLFKLNFNNPSLHM